MASFDSYFSQKNIISELIKIRVNEAKKRNDAYFYKKLNKYARDPSDMYKITGVESYMPPRRKWKRLSKKKRNRHPANTLQKIEIEKTINFYLKKEDYQEEWKVNLINFIGDIKISALQQRYYNFKKPRVFGLPKRSNDKTELRPISSYSLKDRVIINLTSKYFQDTLDQLYESTSYAFRSSKYNAITPTHHHIIDDIISFRCETSGNLYVAEIDIQKFFDTISHAIAKDSIKILTNELNSKGIVVDARAIHFFKSYLKSYSFYQSAKLPLEKRNPGYTVPWPIKELKSIHENIFEKNIGVPQGGALSPVIANIVLHRIDTKIEQFVSDGQLFYARYCDDMIVLSTNRENLLNVLHKYLDVLKSLKLLPHSPKEIGEYSSEFYSMKSKYPYLWKEPENKNESRYISIVGYQIRHDLKLRVKKDSVVRELKKQVEVADRVLHEVKRPGVNKSTKQILFRLTNKLLAMSVGKKNIYDGYELMPMCWASGFKKLKEYDHFKYQLKKLDRNRMRQISRIRRRLKDHNIKPVKPNDEIKGVDYFGPPFSYGKQFKKE